VVVDIAHCERRLACWKQRSQVSLQRTCRMSRHMRRDEPTERLPTMASFRSLGGDGIYSIRWGVFRLVTGGLSSENARSRLEE
jgi:hypothetical protein